MTFFLLCHCNQGYRDIQILEGAFESREMKCFKDNYKVCALSDIKSIESNAARP